MNEVHISSLVLHVIPAKFSQVESCLVDHFPVDICATDQSQGKIVVVLETASMKGVKQAIGDFEQLDGVLTVAMVYHHAESDQSMNEDVA